MNYCTLNTLIFNVKHDVNLHVEMDVLSVYSGTSSSHDA